MQVGLVLDRQADVVDFRTKTKQLAGTEKKRTTAAELNRSVSVKISGTPFAMRRTIRRFARAAGRPDLRQARLDIDVRDLQQGGLRDGLPTRHSACARLQFGSRSALSAHHDLACSKPPGAADNNIEQFAKRRAQQATPDAKHHRQTGVGCCTWRWTWAFAIPEHDHTPFD